MRTDEKKKTGILMEIQKFCLHDGPGIRTTVFFKGCPLRCGWCANPESQEFTHQLQFLASACRSCGSCAAVCPAGALKRDGQGRTRFYPENCVKCGRCVPGCPGNALKMTGAVWTLEEAVREIMKDQVFFLEGGGVTFSGGEVLAQAAFAGELAGALHEQGVHITCETSGFSSHEDFKDLLRWCDLLYLDIKHWDEAAHVRGTGQSGRVILEHLKMAVESKIPMAVRIPVIPGYNDSPEDFHGFGGLLEEFHVTRAHLLPFHQFGSGKYQQLGRQYQYDGRKAMTEDELEPFAAVLKTYIPCVRIGG